MEELSINILVEAKNEYTKQLTNILVPYIYEGVESIYQDSLVLDNKNSLGTFQSLLVKVPKWNQEMIDDETNRIVNASKVSYFGDLLTAVFVANAKILTAVGSINRGRKINLKVPQISEFIHKCYIECAREFHKNPYIFDKNCKAIEKHRNLRESLNIINNSIVEAVRKLLPMQEILQQYLGETFGMHDQDISNGVNNNLKFDKNFMKYNDSEHSDSDKNSSNKSLDNIQSNQSNQSVPTPIQVIETTSATPNQVEPSSPIEKKSIEGGNKVDSTTSSSSSSSSSESDNEEVVREEKVREELNKVEDQFKKEIKMPIESKPVISDKNNEEKYEEKLDYGVTGDTDDEGDEGDEGEGDDQDEDGNEDDEAEKRKTIDLEGQMGSRDENLINRLESNIEEHIKKVDVDKNDNSEDIKHIELNDKDAMNFKTIKDNSIGIEKQIEDHIHTIHQNRRRRIIRRKKRDEYEREVNKINKQIGFFEDAEGGSLSE
jgi:hypothetical protein